SLRKIEDLTRLPVIRDHGAPNLWDVWLAAKGHAGLTLGQGPVFSDSSLCLDAAISGQGVIIAWPMLAEDVLRDRRLVVPFAGSVPTGLAYWLVTFEGGRPSAKVRAFASWIKAELKTGSQSSLRRTDPDASNE